MPKTKKIKVVLIILVVLIVLGFSLYTWLGTERWVRTVQEGDQWYTEPELSRMEVRDAYNLAFQKIILLGGFIFVSAFLFLRVSRDNKNLSDR